MNAQPTTLAAARATSNALLERDAIDGLDVTELHGDEAAAQWGLAVALQRAHEMAYAATKPGEL